MVIRVPRGISAGSTATTPGPTGRPVAVRLSRGARSRWTSRRGRGRPRGAAQAVEADDHLLERRRAEQDRERIGPILLVELRQVAAEVALGVRQRRSRRGEARRRLGALGANARSTRLQRAEVAAR